MSAGDLFLDIGNSRIKYRRGGESDIGQLPHAGDDNESAVARLAALEAARGRRVWVAQVLGEAMEGPLSAALCRAGAREVHFAHTRAQLGGLRVAYEQPKRLGVDRFLAMLGLWRERDTGFLVASAGTALTLDIVNDDGQHLGGYIAPGLRLMRQAVLEGTRFEHREAARAVDHPGTSTESCVAEAALAAALGLLERVGERHPWPAVLCGGDAPVLQQGLDSLRWQLRDAPVLDGLLHYARLAETA